MNCAETRVHLLDLRRGRLAAGLEREVESHVEGCPACIRAREEEALLDDLLARLPARPASPALKRRLAALAASSARAGADEAEEKAAERPARAAPRRRWRTVAPALAAGVFAVAAAAVVLRVAPRPPGALEALASEAVTDHLRVLQRERPVDVESTGRHEVKPWFEGKLDFAPSVPAPVAPDMTLVGGSLGYFQDRPAAVVVYHLRRHVLTLLAFRADRLDWPAGAAEARVPVQHALRGFHVFLWRSGDVGYALVSDSDPAELSGIAGKLAAGT